MEHPFGNRISLACTGLGLVACLWATASLAQQVNMQDNFFDPQTIEIEVGDTVTWVNQGNMSHTTTSDDGHWDSGLVSPGGQFSHTFNQAGSFPYFCQPHGAPGGIGMSGTVIVSGAVVTYTVSTQVSGPGSISPTSAEVEEGETAEFILTPDSGASIDSASGCGGSLDGNVYTTGPIVEDCTVFAEFSFDTHTVSTTVSGPGSIDPESAQVQHGQTAEFTLTPESGAGIDSASGCNGSLSGKIYTTGPITEPCTVSAEFSLDVHDVSTSVSGPGAIDPESAQVEHGQTTEFTLTADANAGLDEVSGCDGSLDGNLYTTGPITGPCTVSASFSLDTYTVTTSVTGPGSISPTSAEVEHGATAEFTVHPQPGAVVDSVSGCDGNLAGNTYITGPITEACTVSAVFMVDESLIYHDRFEATEPES